MKILFSVGCAMIVCFAGWGSAFASECNGTNVLGTWHRRASDAFPDTATWTFLQDSSSMGTIECSGDCARRGGRPVGWVTPGDFFDQPGTIKIRFEAEELIMGCDIEGTNAMIWTLNGERAMLFERF